MNKQTEQKRTSVYPVFTCDVCGEPIEIDEEGYVQIDLRDADNVKNMRRIAQDNRESRSLKLEGDTSLVDILTLSDLVDPSNQSAEWEAVHTKCDLDDEGNMYFFHTSDLRTFEEVLQVNSHVADKTWAEYTNWSHFLQRQLAPYDG